MNYIDFATAVAIFLFFIGIIFAWSTNYFSRLSSLTKISVESLFKIIFTGKGVPDNWYQDSNGNPVEVGLAEDLYLVHFLVKENTGLDRTDEPITAHVIFDENCQNKSWNTTIRMYDEDDKELKIEISNTTFCSSQFLKESDITWEVNISANQSKKYFLYYSSDEDISNPNYSLSYNTSSWIPNDGDTWTETTTDWSRSGGLTGTPTIDSIEKIKGNNSINITGTFNSYYLGLDYNPTNYILGVDNNWYLDFWIYVDDVTGLDYMHILVAHNMTSRVETNFSGLNSGVWYHFEKQLNPSLWFEYGTFNASEGIDRVIFNMFNSTSDLTRTLKIDGLHFKKPSLEIKTFPAEKIMAISENKFYVLKNLSYDKIRNTICENCEFKIEIDGDTYGEDISQLSNVVCHESPKLIEYRNGTIKNVIAKMCVGE